MGEIERVRSVYADYVDGGRANRWTQDFGIHQERQSLLHQLIAARTPRPGFRVLDLGCGRGDLLAELVAAGVPAEGIVGLDLLAGRLAVAHARGVDAVLGSAGALPFADASFDLVTAFTLVSSIGDETILQSLRTEIARVLRPQGSLVVYDMRLPSPGNQSVRPVTAPRLRRMFAGWQMSSRTCTLLPPLARRFAPLPGRRYRLLASLPPLRSHRLSILTPPRVDGIGLPPMPDHPTVSVVLPVRNEVTFIDQSLGAVVTQNFPHDRLEVFVVDGRSDDGTPGAAQRIAATSGVPVTVLDNPARIVPVSMNLALKRASGDVVIRVDGHCVIDADYVRCCIDALQRTGAECVGGPMETIGQTATAAAIAAAQSSRFGVGGVAFRTSEKPAFVDTLAFGAYRREVFDRIGGFDEELVRNQDDELNLRRTRAGGRIWMDPTIRSTYFSRGTFAGLWRQYHGYGFYKVRVMRKHRTVPSPRHLVPAAFVAGVSGSLALSLVRRSPVPAATVLGPYLVGLTLSSVQAATGPARPAPIALASATMHAAYGLGWWSAALREVVRTPRGGAPNPDRP